jgi:beta-glucosidase
VARAGRATVFPQAIAMAATFDDALVKRVATVISDEARAKFNEAQAHGVRGRYHGLTFFSPNINIFRDPRWGRGHETVRRGPAADGAHGRRVHHRHAGRRSHYWKTIATAKHFAVHSGPDPDRTRSTRASAPTISPTRTCRTSRWRCGKRASPR